MLGTIPQLSTANTSPLLQFEQQLIARSADIEAWFRSQWLKTKAPFYCSVDLRNAGFKLAPVDTNLFPGGFNNLNTDFEPLCIQAIQSAVERACPTATGVLLVPENHTRNKFYLENVATIYEMIREAGFHVRIGSLLPEIREPTTLKLEISGREIVLEPLVRDGDRVKVGDFSPCIVLLNNDLSAGIPPILEGIK